MGYYEVLSNFFFFLTGLDAGKFGRGGHVRHILDVIITAVRTLNMNLN